MPDVPATDRQATWVFDDPVLTDDKALRSLWDAIGKLTNAHRAPMEWSARGTFKRKEAPGPYIRLHFERYAGNLFGAACVAVEDLLGACTRLRECPECQRLFVARRRQERHAKCARQRRDRNRPSRSKKSKKPAKGTK